METSTNNHQDDLSVVECSDEESFFPDTGGCVEGGRKFWEPPGSDIVTFYTEIHRTGYVELQEWRCPGRISPSQFDQLMANHRHPDENGTGGQSGLTPTSSLEPKTEFDFDNDFDNDLDFGTNQSNTAKRKKSQATKKSQTTNLTKVMQDIKKYQHQMTNNNNNVDQT